LCRITTRDETPHARPDRAGRATKAPAAMPSLPPSTLSLTESVPDRDADQLLRVESRSRPGGKILTVTRSAEFFHAVKHAGSEVSVTGVHWHVLWPYSARIPALSARCHRMRFFATIDFLPS
jgi:hypothetical protein